MKLKLSQRQDYAHAKLSAIIFKRDQYQCSFCESVEDLVIDHIVPIKMGGKSTLENQRTLCRGCHGKHTNTKKESELSVIGKYLRNWRKKNPEYFTNYHKEWRKKNKGYYSKKYNSELYRAYKQI